MFGALFTKMKTVINWNWISFKNIYTYQATTSCMEQIFALTF